MTSQQAPISRAAATPPDGPPAPPKAWRSVDDYLIGGVAGGLAVHLRVPVMWLRIVFIVLTVFGGMGVVLYGALWLVLPSQPVFDTDAPGLDAARRQGRRPGRGRRLTDVGPLVAAGAVALGLLVLLSMVNSHAWGLWPLLLAAGGVAFLWRQADEAQRERTLDSSGRLSVLRAFVGGGGWASYLRIVLGVAAVVAAIVLVTARTGGWAQARDAALAALLGVLGLAFILGPWLVRLARELGEERAERVRSQERADVAAHLHDSVLQTLALIQKSAADPAIVARLARSQERDLRAWLFEGDSTHPTTVATALRGLAGEVDDAHGVPVEVVCVGDTPLTVEVRPIVLATREAVVNAARHSGAERVDVYAEVGPAEVAVFVRDRGRGFDPDTVAADRHGVRNSIVDRMARHGGAAEVRSGTGTGTEVRLTLPLRTAAGGAESAD
ncbi:MAG TPA: PspC domain-containing protein [Marmoricola sp.]|jgi:signal transduction histidine kinase/phage shock protein PspC (stress-responsive transcriptional regulator)|nr:PspC domain-containing protein [Marmoricola sp.]